MAMMVVVAPAVIAAITRPVTALRVSLMRLKQRLPVATAPATAGQVGGNNGQKAAAGAVPGLEGAENGGKAVAGTGSSSPQNAKGNARGAPRGRRMPDGEEEQNKEEGDRERSRSR